ncbi:protein SIEVE ELEMENT OCCLUSION B-like [Neltuma alba]|uniref:protein SIEVE ELEMENT OCCLUSION B-like n=1 Tax=Neltuma alba TaxID=207710 RepID=UPI0010A4DB74|nr:protein SIEVE ELEMENT OCCLUSION B-like [Prosopis alba]
MELFQNKKLVVSASSLLDKINPFTATDEAISNHIIGIHDSQAPKYDIGSLYNVVSNIVKSSTHIGTSLDLKRPKAVELVEDKVPQSSFMPPFSTLKEIACQMTCKPFEKSTAHQTVVGILEKLKSYSWDAKAVIALSAFSLDFGETWRLSLMERTKENALELHIFRLAEEAKPSKNNLDLINTLVDISFKLIEGISTLEKKIADKSPSQTLYHAPRELYAYWAILALLTCSNRMTELDWNIKSEVVGKLNHVLMRLNNELNEIQREEDEEKDQAWREDVFKSPSGIVDLLRALIFSREITELEIFDNTTQKVVSNDVLKTKNLLLFISGLDNIEDEIWALKFVHEAFKKDEEKQNYQILWVPVVEETDDHKITDDQKEKFKQLKSNMPWYVLQNLFAIKGKKVLEEKWHYQGKPIVVVTNPKGQVIHRNAMYMIFVWKIEAFPFRHEDEERLSLQWKWFWNEATKVFPDIGKWIQSETYIFIYGGTDVASTQRIGTLLDSIKKDPIIKQADAIIEHFNFTTKHDQASNFWASITNSMLSRLQKKDHEQDTVLKEIETLLSYKNEKAWALLSKGANVLVIGFDSVVTNVLETFEEWKVNVQVLQGFDNAFIKYYNEKKASVPPPCLHFQLNNIRSGVPFTISCPEPSCKKKIMEVETVSYNCCHGIHSHNAPLANLNGEIGTPLLKAKWTP